jgi:hypothetical protein
VNDPWADERKKLKDMPWKDWDASKVAPLLADADALLAVVRAAEETVREDDDFWGRYDLEQALAALPEYLREKNDE